MQIISGEFWLQVKTWGCGPRHRTEPVVQDMPANARNIKGQVCVSSIRVCCTQAKCALSFVHDINSVEMHAVSLEMLQDMHEAMLCGGVIPPEPRFPPSESQICSPALSPKPSLQPARVC